MIVPVTDRGDAIGLLEMTLPRLSRARRRSPTSASAAHALAYVRHRRPPAHRRLRVGPAVARRSPWPPRSNVGCCPASFTHQASQFTVAGWLEPATTVGGDTFDYAIDHGMLHVSITDAVGHQVAAALLATLLVGEPPQRAAQGPRPRRAGARTPTTAWPRTPHPGQFVTGQLLRVDLRTGTAGDRQRRAPAPAAAPRRPGGGGRRCASRRPSASCPGKSLRRSRPSRSSRATGSSC